MVGMQPRRNLPLPCASGFSQTGRTRGRAREDCGGGFRARSVLQRHCDPFGPLTFPEPGEYGVDLIVNGVSTHVIPLSVVMAEEPPTYEIHEDLRPRPKVARSYGR